MMSTSRHFFGRLRAGQKKEKHGVTVCYNSCAVTNPESSDQPRLDASALATVHASAPFERPPDEMKFAFVVGYGKKK
jgi:hypothetical protein